MSLDDLFDQMDHDELADATHLSPIEFARLKGMQPQLVYYYIRQGVVTVERCKCGRKVIDVEASAKAIQTRQEARGRRGNQSGISLEPDPGTEE